MISSAFPEAMPLQGFIGGLLIGLAAAILLIGVGRIAGVSGLTARAVGLGGGAPWILAVLFVLGLPLGAGIFLAAGGQIDAVFNPSLPLVALAGLITGFGTRMGSGCTSGHGVCGMSRLSRRSLIATGTFIGAGMVTVAIANALGWGWSA